MGKKQRLWSAVHSGRVNTSLICIAAALAGTGTVQAAEGYQQIEEITVTARKRAENLQDTPIAITAFSSEGLENRGISDISQIGEYTPNLVFDSTSAIAATSSAASIYIRGIGQSDWALAVDPGVGLYLDGVYIARSVGGVMDLLDLERVEVLRGPQGTLFGRNTIGGAISLVTKKPGDEFYGDAEISLGRYDRLDARASVNIPIADTLAANIAVSSKKRDGYVENLHPGSPDLGDEDAQSGRLALRWTPSDNFEVNFSADATKEREAPAPNVLLAVDETAIFPLAWNGGAFPINRYGIPSDPSCANMADPSRLSNPLCFNSQWIAGPHKTYSTHTTPNDFVNTNFIGRGMKPESDLDLWGTSLTAEWAITDKLTLKSITAYRDLDGYWARDTDHSPLVILQTLNEYEQDQFTQELQLQGTAMNERLQWITGLYYFEEEGCHLDIVELAGAVFDSGGCIDNTSKAVFGQATYDITEKLSVTVGLRWTDEDKRFTPDSSVAQDNGLGIPAGVLVLPMEEGKVTDEEVDPYLNIAYRWTESLMTYASYSEGFKGGGFTQRVFPPRTDVPDFQPEFVKAYEVGFKSDWFDNRLRLNGAVFFTDYTDLQVNVDETSLGRVGEIGVITRNAAEAEIFGFELELLALPADGWMIEAGVGYLDAEYSEISGLAQDAGLTKGHELVNTPEWSVTTGISYRWEVGGLGTLIPRVDYSYTSKVYNNALNTPLLTQSSVELVNASLAFDSSDEKWSAAIAVHNLTDEDYLVTGNDDPGSGIIEGVYAMPRTWSVRIKRQF